MMSKDLIFILQFHTVIALAVGFLLDLAIGDPRWLYHPVCAIGKLIEWLERGIRKRFPRTERGERTGGGLLVGLVCLCCFLVPFGILVLLYRIQPWLGLLAESFLCYQMLATKSLKTESMKVYAPLKAHDLPSARQAVSMIVGRDTQSLTEEGVTKATVETIAENTSDGIIAPMFFMALGGVPLLYLYKGINTMDSMLGYKNEKYLHFGRYAAKLDDVANYIPARLAAWLMIGGSALLGYSAGQARKIYLRDRRNHASPNSAQTEAVMAGALGVQLAGNAYYFGKLYEKPTIGDALRPVESKDILRANGILYATSALGVLAFSCLHLLLCLLL